MCDVEMLCFKQDWKAQKQKKRAEARGGVWNFAVQDVMIWLTFWFQGLVLANLFYHGVVLSWCLTGLEIERSVECQTGGDRFCVSFKVSFSVILCMRYFKKFFSTRTRRRHGRRRNGGDSCGRLVRRSWRGQRLFALYLGLTHVIWELLGYAFDLCSWGFLCLDAVAFHTFKQVNQWYNWWLNCSNNSFLDTKDGVSGMRYADVWTLCRLLANVVGFSGDSA